MKIYRIAKEGISEVYRICVARQDPDDASILECKSLYNPNPNLPTKWTPISVGSVLNGRWYVGTKAKFCLAYYSDMSKLEYGENEVLLTLEVPSSSVPAAGEDGYMGSEAVVSNTIVTKIEKVLDVKGKLEYQ